MKRLRRVWAAGKSRGRYAVLLPVRAVRASREGLLAVRAQELALLGVVLLGIGFGVGVAGVALLLIGLGLTLDWTERIR